jgi:hypothetical protein
MSLNIDNPSHSSFKTEPNPRNRDSFPPTELTLPAIPRHKFAPPSIPKPSQSIDTQSDKILNQFLMNYFKKKHKLTTTKPNHKPKAS